jgi:hypothetical protein
VLQAAETALDWREVGRRYLYGWVLIPARVLALLLVF